jgi:Zn-dependent peptidase ImmA (M78 family)
MAKDKIPNTVKIAGITYIIDKNADEYLAGAGLQGLCDANQQVIAISNSYPDERRYETFIHELLHAIVYESGGSNYLGEKEEDFVFCVSKVLCQVLKENRLGV